MANVTIPQAGSASERTLAHEALLADKAEEQARIRRAALDAPWYTEKLDPTNFGSNEFLDPQHIAMFNGTRGGRTAASFPERTLDSGLHFNPTPPALTPSSGSGKATVNPLHPEILTSIILDLWTPSTCNGALGQALAVATDAPPSIAGPSDDPLTISPPLDPDNLPPPPPPAGEGTLRAKREALRTSEQGQGAGGQPTDDAKQEAAEKRQRDQEAEEKRKRDEAAKRK